MDCGVKEMEDREVGEEFYLSTGSRLTRCLILNGTANTSTVPFQTGWMSAQPNQKGNSRFLGGILGKTHFLFCVTFFSIYKMWRETELAFLEVAKNEDA